MIEKIRRREYRLPFIGAVVILFCLAADVWIGCGSSFRPRPDTAAPRCRVIKEHLVAVGCFQDPGCSRLVHALVEEHITRRLPEDVPFEPICDITVMTGIFPIDCVMGASTPRDVLACKSYYTGSW